MVVGSMNARFEVYDYALYKAIAHKNISVPRSISQKDKDGDMKTLFVNACTRGNESRTYKLAQAYLEGMTYDEVTLADLNLVPYTQAMIEKRLQFQLAGDFSDPLFDLAKQFADADEIVIAAPYWD